MADNFYFDFSKKGQNILGDGDVPVILNTVAIRESISNLLLTSIGTYYGKPRYGMNLERYLFEIIDVDTAEMIQSDIHYALQHYASIIKDLVVNITVDNTNATYLIDVIFTVIYTNTTETIKIDFKKIR